jgi:hypothetical protein
MDLVDMEWGGVGEDWFGLDQVRDRWRAPVNSVMKFWIT